MNWHCRNEAEEIGKWMWVFLKSREMSLCCREWNSEPREDTISHALGTALVLLALWKEDVRKDQTHYRVTTSLSVYDAKHIDPKVYRECWSNCSGCKTSIGGMIWGSNEDASVTARIHVGKACIFVLYCVLQGWLFQNIVLKQANGNVFKHQ